MPRIRSAALIVALCALGAASLPAVATAAPDATAVPTDAARAATATASSVELDRADFAARFAIDGDSSTRWSSKYTDAEWLQLAFAEPTPVHTVEIDWPNACARAFSLQTSTDGENWTTVAQRSGQSTCPRTDAIEVDVAEPVSYLRMQGAQRWAAYGFSISEMRVWDAAPPEPEPSLALIPAPVSLIEGEGEYLLGAEAAISASGDALAAAELLAGVLRPSTGFELPIDAAAADAAIEIVVAPGEAPAGHADEGYALDVDATGIRIGADTAAGAINAVQTLRQLLPAWAGADEPMAVDWRVPHVEISDYPRFEYRGFMVDTARSFYTVAEVKEFVDAASPLKLNRLHLHLTDDQGWRLVMDTPGQNPSGIDYGLLTEVSGATAMTYNDAGDLMGTELGRTGFYTKADYTEIVEYAAANGMTVVPEIDMPGHTNAALHAIPQLNSAGSTPQPAPGADTVPAQGSGNVGESSLDAGNDATYEFITEVLTQLAELTPGQYLHIGGDEAHSTSTADYTRMVDFANAAVASLGKTVIGWNEYAGTDLPDGDAVVQYWNGAGANVAAAVRDQGARVILSPANRTYFPQKQDMAQPNGGTWACGGACTLENAYSWNPAAQISGVGEDAVLGVEGAFWGEFIRGVDQAEFFSFPRLLAVAETGWTPQAGKDTADFVQRVADIGPRLAIEGVNFFPTATVAWSADAAATVGGAGPGARALAAEPGEETRIDWVVAAPRRTTAEVTGTVTWSDGVVDEIVFDTEGVSDIAAMTLGARSSATTSRELTEPGVYTAQLEVVIAGEPVAVSAVSVRVAAEDGGAGDDEVGAEGPGVGEETNPGGGGGGGASAGGGAAGGGGALAATGYDGAGAVAALAVLLLAAGGGLVVLRRTRAMR
ncbi:family 20 glycosylhydrolase [uncultured Microbacterium sp.]|uniref:family 20 glycosylhydrolase n=1 Tax=uncultured Microbacterium sp. TaxID=191216 RepID=UPI002616EBE5|nr:family 20 glycosylhydrolase [uncultured Microbacterium sp.]